MKGRVSPGFLSVTSSVTDTVTETRKKLELLGTDALTSLNFLELDISFYVVYSKVQHSYNHDKVFDYNYVVSYH